jgi:hypothetical protein
MQNSGGSAVKVTVTLVPEITAIANQFDVLRRRLRRNFYASELDLMRHYKQHFPYTARVFPKFLRRCDLAAVKSRSLTGRGQSVGVVVTPWVATPVPWFSIALGLALARRGANIRFIWDDTVFPQPSPQLDLQNGWIDRILEHVRPYFPVVRLGEEQPEPIHPGDDVAVERLVRLNLVWSLRGGSPSTSDLQKARHTRAHLGDTLTHIRGMLARTPMRYVVVPGGVYGTSGLYLHAGKESGTRVATFDSGLGWSVVCPDGVAAHQADVPRAFEALYRTTDAELADAIETARSEYALRVRGSDRMAYQAGQPEAMDDVPGDAVLIPLSVEFDSAALGRHLVFDDSADWLVATVRHLLDHTDATVVVRQHPSERRELERSYFRVDKLLGQRFGDHPRYQFVGADQDINTYGLLNRARVVLPYASTIGIEAAALGKRVILASQPYFRSLGFTWNANSRAEYFSLIERAVAGRLPLLPDQVRRAWLCFYINAVCYRVFTDFTGQPTDFWKWCRRDPEELFATPEVQDLLTAIDDDRPVPLLQHEHRTAADRHPARVVADRARWV